MKGICVIERSGNQIPTQEGEMTPKVRKTKVSFLYEHIVSSFSTFLPSKIKIIQRVLNYRADKGGRGRVVGAGSSPLLMEDPKPPLLRDRNVQLTRVENTSPCTHPTPHQGVEWVRSTYGVTSIRMWWCTLTLVLLNPDMSFLCKQSRSRSVGFWRSQLIWICTICH